MGFSSSPYILNATIKHHLEKSKSTQPEFVTNAANSLYVDDFTFSSPSEEKVFATYKSLKQCFHEGGFDMRKWASNSKALLEKIQNTENKFDLESFENSIHEDELIKVLGPSWNQNTDKLIFHLSTFKSAAAQQPPTKRLILSTIA